MKPLGSAREPSEDGRCNSPGISSKMTNPIPTHRPVDVEELKELEELAERDGYERAVQDIDLLTGGDGEYRASTDPERHTPDAAAMKARIAARFEALLSTIRGLEEVRAAQSQPIVSSNGHTEAEPSAANELPPAEAGLIVFPSAEAATNLAGREQGEGNPDDYLLDALREAEVGLRFAGADKADSSCDFTSTPALALRAVRAALARAASEVSSCEGTLAPRQVEREGSGEANPPPTKSDEPHSGGGEG